MQQNTKNKILCTLHCGYHGHTMKSEHEDKNSKGKLSTSFCIKDDTQLQQLHTTLCVKFSGWLAITMLEIYRKKLDENCH